MLVTLTVILSLILLAMAARQRMGSFAAQKPADYAGGPAFDIRERLNGPLVCEGVIFGPMGRVASQFDADIDVTWAGNVGTMTERFRYDSGVVQDRSWTLTLRDDGTIRAEAEDVVGPGTGQQHGSTVMLRYRIRLTKEAGGHVLDTIDWMYLGPNGAITNRSQFRMFGIKVAELVATIRPRN